MDLNGESGDFVRDYFQTTVYNRFQHMYLIIIELLVALT